MAITTRRIVKTATLPLIPLRGMVVFPRMLLHFEIGREKSALALRGAMDTDQTVFLVAQKNLADADPSVTGLYATGVVAKICQVLKTSGDTMRVLVEGLYRAKVTEVIKEDPFMLVTVRERPEPSHLDSLQEEALVRRCRVAFSNYADLAQEDLVPDVMLGVAAAEKAGYLADFIAANLPMPVEEKMMVLQTLPTARRAELLISILNRETEVLRLEKDIQSRVQERMDQSQKEYYLREQMRVIAEELGDADNPLEEAQEYAAKIDALHLDEKSSEVLRKEVDKLAKMPVGSHEATVVRNYLDTCLALPWHTASKLHLDMDNARRVLDHDHYGLEKVKEHILETLAVGSLSKEAQGQVLCLVGPPGVGKTSVAKSVARATGRKYVRVALGGVHDESEIRGHRRTYLGSMPGRIIRAIQQAGVNNPLILLDEIDKMGSDFHGDPTAAMLEVLDTEQNNTFTDHYIDLPFDLSGVMFITTANDADAIPAPLYDRMDILRLPSYTAREKFHIARDYLVKKQLKHSGLSARQLRITDEALTTLIENYTREAGVRELERQIGKLCRKAAKKLVAGECKSLTVKDPETLLGPKKYRDDVTQLQDQVGVVNGLAWTAVGGETMPIEVAVMDGTGKIELTGSLGDVMKESARTAISYVRSCADAWHIDKDFYKNKDIHIHVPEGAVPKDGPSAGVTMATAIISALTGIPVKGDVAMTGEITLRGRVLPIGGLREKTMAAYTHHMKTVIIPKDNQPDLAEVDGEVKEHVRFVPVAELSAVLQNALTRPAP